MQNVENISVGLALKAIEPMLKVKCTRKNLDYTPCNVIMGRKGVGKTTLFNMLCKTQHAAGEAAASVTDKLYLNNVSVGEDSFCLIDTPGTNSKTDCYKHAVLVRESLTAKNINTIFIVVKYEKRFDDILDNYLEVQELVYKYTHKIVILVSHWDECRKPKEAFEETCKLFENCCANLIVYSEFSVPEEVAKLMFACLSNMMPEKIDIPDDDFYLKYNICEARGGLLMSLRNHEIEIQKISIEYQELLKRIFSNNEYDRSLKDEMLHYLIIEFRNQIEKISDEFIRNYSGMISDIHYFTLFIKIQKANIKYCDEYVELVVSNMSYNPNDKDDPRNMIKRCPFCGLIWLKVEGCDNATICGSIPTSYFDFETEPKPFYGFIIKKINGYLNLFRTELPRRFGSMQVGKKCSKGVGCGNQIIWKDCPRVEDALIIELFKVQTIDQAKELVKQENFQNIRNSVEASIDKNFYS